jgi:hypothetical protein
MFKGGLGVIPEVLSEGRRRYRAADHREDVTLRTFAGPRLKA